MLNELLSGLQSNQALLAGLGIGGAGILTFWLKDFPKYIISFVQREITTSVTMTSQNIVFYKALRWLEKNYKEKNFRKLKISNGKWGHEETTTFSVGYGHHLVWYKHTPLIIELEKDTNNQTEHDKESLIFTKIGRSKRVFQHLIKEIEAENKDDSKIKLYKFNEEWEFIREIKKRPLSSVFIDESKKKCIIERITKFINSEEWYNERGIPYQLGVVLHGPAGTGKTSFIKAIASHFDYPIYVVPASRLIKLEKAFEKLTEKSIVVIEDIDCQTLTHSRLDPENTATTKTLTDSLKAELGQIGLSEILNAIDGFCSTEGRILFATTNHPEKLDKALLRPGRFDIKMELTYVTEKTATQFLTTHFTEKIKPLDCFELKRDLTIASLQEVVLKGATLDETIDFIKA